MKQTYTVPCAGHEFNFEVTANELETLRQRRIEFVEGVRCTSCGEVHRVSARALLDARAVLLAALALTAGAEAEAEELAAVGDRKKLSEKKVMERSRRKLTERLAVVPPIVIGHADVKRHSEVIPEAAQTAHSRGRGFDETPPPIAPDSKGVTDTTGGKKK
jgi:hypothetical protein